MRFFLDCGSHVYEERARARKAVTVHVHAVAETSEDVRVCLRKSGVLAVSTFSFFLLSDTFFFLVNFFLSFLTKYILLSIFY
jgi:hypothetical protein